MEYLDETEELLVLIKEELYSTPPNIFVSKWIMESIPIIFRENDMEYYSWKHNLASKIKVDARDIIITGSACLGFSLNPNKNFKRFDEYSDIDVAIISNYYFDIAWHQLRNYKYYKLDNSMRRALEDHRHRLIYWGTIATDKILPILSFGKEWNDNIVSIKNESPIDDREVNFRIYKDNKAFRDYQINSIKECQKLLLLEGDTE